MQIAITPRDLAEIAECSPERAGDFCDYLNMAMRQYGIVRLRPQAHFLAQILHESARLRRTEEIWGPTPAQERYDEREDLGNTPEEDGDGYLYRGRGLIQITGKANYEAFQRHLERFYGETKPDVTENPDELAEPMWACISAAWYWRSRGLTEVVLANTDDHTALRSVTRAINGGYNGLPDRQSLLYRALDVLRKAHITATIQPVEVLSPEHIESDINYAFDPAQA